MVEKFSRQEFSIFKYERFFIIRTQRNEASNQAT